MPKRVAEPWVLTYRQRRRLAALGRQLATEDPALAAALSRPAARARAPIEERITWAMFWTGVSLLLAGVLLAVSLLVAVALLLLATFWMPMKMSRLEET